MASQLSEDKIASKIDQLALRLIRAKQSKSQSRIDRVKSICVDNLVLDEVIVRAIELVNEKRNGA